MKIVLVPVTCAILACVPAPAYAEDTRPCVSKREFNGAQAWNRTETELRWDVTDLGYPIDLPPIGKTWIYPRCAYQFPDEAFYGVSYGKKFNVFTWYKVPGATPHGVE